MFTGKTNKRTNMRKYQLNVLLKRNIFVLPVFFKILTEGEFFNSRGKEFHNFGAQTENAQSPYIFKLEGGTASRFERARVVCWRVNS